MIKLIMRMSISLEVKYNMANDNSLERGAACTKSIYHMAVQYNLEDKTCQSSTYSKLSWYPALLCEIVTLIQGVGIGIIAP